MATCPAIYRDGVDFERKQNELYSFVNILERFYRYENVTNILAPSVSFFGSEPAQKALHVATAQHYGLCTHLLDFTTDPPRWTSKTGNFWTGQNRQLTDGGRDK